MSKHTKMDSKLVGAWLDINVIYFELIMKLLLLFMFFSDCGKPCVYITKFLIKKAIL